MLVTPPEGVEESAPFSSGCSEVLLPKPGRFRKRFEGSRRWLFSEEEGRVKLLRSVVGACVVVLVVVELDRARFRGLVRRSAPLRMPGRRLPKVRRRPVSSGAASLDGAGVVVVVVVVGAGVVVVVVVVVVVIRVVDEGSVVFQVVELGATVCRGVV